MQQIIDVKNRQLDPDRIQQLLTNLEKRREQIHDRMAAKVVEELNRHGLRVDVKQDDQGKYPAARKMVEGLYYMWEMSYKDGKPDIEIPYVMANVLEEHGDELIKRIKEATGLDALLSRSYDGHTDDEGYLNIAMQGMTGGTGQQQQVKEIIALLLEEVGYNPEDEETYEPRSSYFGDDEGDYDNEED
jgi:hypothetical protein